MMKQNKKSTWWIHPGLCGVLILSALTASCIRGPRGSTGPAGPAGPPGESLTPDQVQGITATFNCQGTVQNLVGLAGSSLNGLTITYDASLTYAGDVFVTANIIDESFQVSGSMYYAAGQSGASNAAIVINADKDFTSDDAYWRITLNRETLVTSIVYVDDSLGIESPVSLSFTPDACVAQEW